MSDEFLEHISAVQKWLATRGTAKQPDTIGQEVAENMREWLSAGLIELGPENQKYFDLMEAHFPISVNRIDWLRFKHRKEVFLCATPKVGETAEARLAALQNFRQELISWLNEFGISQSDRVIHAGDGSEIVFKMTVETFLECYPVLLVQPQHAYVIPPDGRWCLNYTLESDLYIGKSSDATAKGWLDD